ncbi:MAG: hypothetical protein ACXV5L_13210, partial [Thermoanaerobaculia bacterium]
AAVRTVLSTTLRTRLRTALGSVLGIRSRGIRNRVLLTRKHSARVAPERGEWLGLVRAAVVRLLILFSCHALRPVFSGAVPQ